MNILPAIYGSLLSYLYCLKYQISFIDTKSLHYKIVKNLETFVLGSLTLYFIEPNYIESINIIQSLMYVLTSEFVFYWTHRYLHMNKFLYKYIHQEHHLEKEPCPIDAYILSPSETIIITIALSSPDVLQMPINYYVSNIYKTLSLAILILNHGGFESFHMKHHRFVKGNYGGISPLFDKIFNTFI